MPNQSVFGEEWRDCLRAHYTQVVRNQDTGTERSLHGVMLEAGFREDEIAQLSLRATMHVDNVGADFVPDMDILEAKPETFSVAAVVAPAAESVAPDPIEEVPGEPMVDAEIPVAVVKDLVDEEEATVTEDAPEIADEAPAEADLDVTQLSLF